MAIETEARTLPESRFAGATLLPQYSPPPEAAPVPKTTREFGKVHASELPRDENGNIIIDPQQIRALSQRNGASQELLDMPVNIVQMISAKDEHDHERVMFVTEEDTEKREEKSPIVSNGHTPDLKASLNGKVASKSEVVFGNDEDTWLITSADSPYKLLLEHVNPKIAEDFARGKLLEGEQEKVLQHLPPQVAATIREDKKTYTQAYSTKDTEKTSEVQLENEQSPSLSIPLKTKLVSRVRELRTQRIEKEQAKSDIPYGVAMVKEGFSSSAETTGHDLFLRDPREDTLEYRLQPINGLKNAQTTNEGKPRKFPRRRVLQAGAGAILIGATSNFDRLLAYGEEFLPNKEPSAETKEAQQTVANSTSESTTPTAETTSSTSEVIRGELGEKGFSKFFSALALRAESDLIAPNGIVRLGHIETDDSDEETFVPFAAFRNGMQEEGPGPVKMNIDGTEFGDCLVFEWYPQNGQEQVTLASTISIVQSGGSEVIDEGKTQRYIFTPEYTEAANLPLSDETKIFFEGNKTYDLPITWETLEELKQTMNMFVTVDNIIVRDQEWKGNRAKYYDVVGDGKTIVLSTNIDRMVEQDREMVLLMALSGAWYRQITTGTLQDEQTYEDLHFATDAFQLAHHETIRELEARERPGPIETQGEHYGKNVFAELDTILDAPKMDYKVPNPYSDPEEEFAKTIAAMMYRPEEIMRFTKTASFPDDQSIKLLCGAAYRAMEVSLGDFTSTLDTLLGKHRYEFASWSSPLSFEYTQQMISPIEVGSP